MEFSKEEKKRLLELLNSHKSVTIISHIHPDGDAIGSSLGIYNILKSASYRVEIVNYTKKLPRDFNFLSGFDKIKSKIEFKDSLIITCDSGSIDRLGFNLKDRKVINIDHHKSNREYGSLNIVREEVVSTSIVAYYLFKGVFEIPKSSAEAFYTALVSDSQFFKTQTVNESSFKFAKELIELGADPAYISKMMKGRKSLSSLRLLSRALNSLTLHLDGRLAICKITNRDLVETGADEYDRDGIVDYGNSLATVKISILLIELDKKVKVSFRSKGIDVMEIAKSFGGGGHKEASGFETVGDLENIERELISKIKENGVLN